MRDAPTGKPGVTEGQGERCAANGQSSCRTQTVQKTYLRSCQYPIDKLGCYYFVQYVGMIQPTLVMCCKQEAESSTIIELQHKSHR